MGKCRIFVLAAVFASTLLCVGCGNDDPQDPTDPEVASGWEKHFAIGSLSSGNSVKQTSDGGYIIAGWTKSSLTDLVASVLLLKTDASGNMLWAKVFDAPHDARAVSVLQTPDGGYFVLANYLGNSGEFWIIKTDADGNMVWNQFKGYSDRDESAEDALRTSDGGYALTGTTHYDNDRDIWLVKTGPSGESIWNVTKGYSDSDEYGQSVQQTSDGGYLLVGYTSRSSGPHVWLVKTYANGATHWHQIVATGDPSTGIAICKTNDGAYVIMGEVGQMLADQRRIFLFKYDEAGTELWRGTCDVAGYYTGGEVQQTSDGGFMVATTKQPNMSTSGDFCLIRFDGTGTTLWTRTYGGGFCKSGAQTTDLGYILCGTSPTSTSIYLVKTDPDGNI